MNLEAKIISALSVPLAFPHIEKIIYPDGRPNTWEDLVILGLTLERMVNRGVIHRKATGSVKSGETEHATTQATWPLYCIDKRKLVHAVAPTRIKLKGNI